MFDNFSVKALQPLGLLQLLGSNFPMAAKSEGAFEDLKWWPELKSQKVFVSNAK